MKTAASIYLGVLVDAEDCDRTTYERRALACPICGGAVFWASGEHQSAHFRHFPDTGKPDCEARAARMSAEAWAKKRQVVEQQLYKRLEKSFWRTINSVYPRMRLDEAEADMKKLDARTMGILASFTQKTGKNISKVESAVEYLAEVLQAGTLTVKGGFEDIAAGLSQAARRQSQVVSTKASIKFLAQQRNHEKLKVLAYYCMTDYIQHSEADPDNFPLDVLLSHEDLFLMWVLMDLTGFLICVPWPEAAAAFDNGTLPSEVRTRPRLDGLNSVFHLPKDIQGIYG